MVWWREQKSVRSTLGRLNESDFRSARNELCCWSCETVKAKMSPVTSAKRFVPLLNRVLVEKVRPPTVLAGGILLPETTTKEIQKAGEEKLVKFLPARI